MSAYGDLNIVDYLTMSTLLIFVSTWICTTAAPCFSRYIFEIIIVVILREAMGSFSVIRPVTYIS